MEGEEDAASDSKSQSDDVKDMQNSWGFGADIGARYDIVIAE